ncbi:MAG: hypothetical protein LBU89_10925 [Fibromonadaceae bacterium]|nr:hypothetical protein [Fibromonadaceae bacterium]
MPERVESPSRKADYILRPTPGYVLEKNFEKPIRGIYKASRGFGQDVVMQSLVVCAGSELWQKSGSGDWQMLGHVGDGVGMVSICDDSVAMLVCDGAFAWRIPFDKPAIQRLRPGHDIFIEPHSCAAVGSYTIVCGREMDVNSKESAKFYVNEPLDNSKFAALDYFTADSFSGEVKAVASACGLLWLLGADGAEAWQVTGNSNMPLVRVGGMFFSGCGLLGPHSFASGGDSLFWLGQGSKGNGIAYLAVAGMAPKRVSTIPIEEEWQSYKDLANAYASQYASGGHSFYLLSFPQSRKTWVFDTETGLWHERQSGPAGKRTMWEPAILQAVRQDTFGANPDGRIFKLAPPQAGEDGAPVLRRRTTPAVDTKERRARHNCLSISMQSGTGEVKLMLRFSDDNGYTWGATRTLKLGSVGQYARLAQFRMLGTARRRVYELDVSDPVGVAIVRAAIAMDIMGVRS